VQRAKEKKFLSDLAQETGIDINRLRALWAGEASIVPNQNVGDA